MPIFVTALGGLLIGSFMNVVNYRLPRHESLVHPGSHCPNCGAPVKPYDNIPVISWLLLRGRCRGCRAPISVRYPAVELLSAVLAVIVVVSRSGVHDIALDLTLVAVLIPVAFIDLERRIIPNVILAPAAVLALAIGLLTRPSGVPEQLIAAAAGGGFLLIFALAYPRGMGMGDVKLAAVLGLFLGRSVAPAILVALVTGVLFGVAVMTRVGTQEGRRTAVPFGPFLALGGVVAIVAGPAIVHWYLHTVI
jgi:leader peptidase (prepilin peptidase)/N-methyltransferase